MRQPQDKNFEYFTQNQQSYQPILSKLEIRFPKLKKTDKKYQSPNISPQRVPLFKKNSYPSEDQTKQQTKIQYSSQTTLQKLLQQLQGHSKKMHNVVYNKQPSEKEKNLQISYYKNNSKDYFNGSNKNRDYQGIEYQQVRNQAKKEIPYGRYQKNQTQQNYTGYSIKSSREIINQWRAEKLLSKNLLGTHWEVKLAAKFFQLKKQAFQSIKSQFCISNGILATQSRLHEPIKYQKLLQNVGVGFSKMACIFKFKTLTKLRDALIKMKFYNDISGVYAKQNQTTTSNKNMFTSFFQLSDNQITKEIISVNQNPKPILSNKSILKEKPSKISVKQIKQIKQIKQSERSAQKLLRSQSQSNSRLLEINSNINSKIDQKQKQLGSRVENVSRKKNYQYQKNENNYQTQYKVSTSKPSQVNSRKIEEDEYNFRTGIKSINLIGKVKKDQMRIYPYSQKKEQATILHCEKSYKNQPTAKSQQIQPYNCNPYISDNLKTSSNDSVQILYNCNNKKIIGLSMDQQVLQRNSRSSSRQFYLPGNKVINQPNYTKFSTQKQINVFSKDVSTPKKLPHKTQFQTNYERSAHSIRPGNSICPSNSIHLGLLECNNRVYIRQQQQNRNIINTNLEENRMKRCFSHQNLSFKCQINPFSTKNHNQINPASTINKFMHPRTMDNPFSQTQIKQGPLVYQNYNQNHPLVQRFSGHNQRQNSTRISTSNQKRLPVIFTNYQPEPYAPQSYRRPSRSLSANCFTMVTPTFVQQTSPNHQSKVVFQNQPQIINLHRQRQSSTDSYGQLLKQPYIKQAKPQQIHHIVRQRQVREVNSQYFIGNRQLQNNKAQTAHMITRENPNSLNPNSLNTNSFRTRH